MKISNMRYLKNKIPILPTPPFLWKKSESSFLRELGKLNSLRKGKKTKHVENAAQTLLQWFQDNQMKLNPEKYLWLENNNKGNWILVTKRSFKVKKGHKLNFNGHGSSLNKKLSQKLYGLSQLAKVMILIKD